MNVLIHCCIELPVSTNLENIANSFSEPKKKLLYYLKVMQQAGLEELAKAMKISRMGVHKHLALLQKRGLVEGVQTRSPLAALCVVSTSAPRSFSNNSVSAEHASQCFSAICMIGQLYSKITCFP